MNLGIDFGTTRTVVAYADRGNYPVVSFLDPEGDSHDWFPSVVAEREGAFLFGWEAVAASADPSFSMLRSFKRVLSDPSAVPGKPVRVGSTTLPVVDLIERFLLALKEALSKSSNLRTEKKPKPLQCVVAVPANAHGAQRFVTLEAFRRAGFAPSAVLNEPSAAGFEYSHRHRDTLTSKREHVVVYDLGGGTFDASLVRMRERSHEVLATAGINRLGGDDFDGALMTLACEEVGLVAEALSPAARGLLLDQCREAKERLSPNSRKIDIDLGAAEFPTLDATEAVVPVARFYQACLPLVERSIEAMVPLMARLEGEEDALAGIYVVGGASELPIVTRALRERFGRRVHRSPYPSAATAIGLAIACDDEAGFELSDLYTRTFGVFRERLAGGEITIDTIFGGQTSLPARSEAVIRCRRDYRAAHNLGHFRFVECGAVTEDGRPQGDLTVSGDVLFPFDPRLGSVKDLSRVAVERIGSGPLIEEEYALDRNGIVTVKIRNVDGGYERQYRIGD